MKVKGLIVTFFTLFFFAATALAGGPANMKTDVPTIPEADCDQAGWISLEVLGGFDLHEGDQIVWSTTNLVPLCKDIDIFLSVTELTSKAYPQTNISAIFTTNAADVVDVAGTDVNAGALANPLVAGDAWDLGFLIQGTSGSTRINLTVTRRFNAVVTNLYDAALNPTGNYVGQIGQGQWDHDVDPLTPDVPLGSGDYIMTVNTTAVGGAPTDVLTLRLFDSNNDAFVIGALAGQAGWFERDAADPFGYIDGTEPEDNVLCLDTNNDAILVNGQYVWATPDSQPGTLPGASQVSFSGDYTIANISGSEGYTVDTVGKGQCETVSIGATFDQFGNPIGDEASLDVGDYLPDPCTGSRWVDQVGTCETDEGYGALVSKSVNFGAADSFRMVVSLAVSSDGGSTYTDIDMDEAWFDGNGNMYETMANNLGITQCDSTQAVVSNMNLGANPTLNTDGDAYILDSNFVTVQGNSYDSFLLDIPQISYLKSAFAAGDIIAMKVELYKFPCGLVETDYVCLANAVEDCPDPGGPTTGVFFPYGVGADNTAFWTGIALTNTSGNDGTATVTFYGTEGGESTYTIDVAARDIETFAMTSIMDDPDMTGTLTGAENFQAIVSADFGVDGLMFIGGRGTNTVLHGYLPRQVGP